MRLRAETALVAALLAASAAAETNFVPRISVGEAYESNVTLAPPGEELHDWVTELKPGFSLDHKSARLEFDLSYDLQALYYAENDDYNDVFNSLYGSGTAELVEQRLFLDLDADYYQSNVEPAGRLATSNFYRTGNATNVGQWQASPWWRQPLGSAAEATLRYTLGQTDFHNTENEASDLQDSDQQRFDFNVGTPADAAGWTWRLDYLNTQVDYDEAPEYQYQRAGAELGIPVGSRNHLLMSAGMESDLEEDRSDAGLDTEWWNVGWRWTPTARQTLEARVGQRFWGNDYLFIWKREGSRGNLELSYAETPDTYGALDFDSGPGPIDGWFGQGRIDQRVYLNKQLSGTASYETARSQLSLQLYRDQRDYLEDEEPDDTFTKDEDYYGVRAGWNWQAFTRTRLDLDLWWERRDLLQGEGDLTQVTLSLVREITRQLDARLAVSYLDNSSDAGTLPEYEASSAFLEVTWHR